MKVTLIDSAHRISGLGFRHTHYIDLFSLPNPKGMDWMGLLFARAEHRLLLSKILINKYNGN